MAFIVQASRGQHFDDVVSITLESSRDALAAALRWAEEEKIIGNGRIYTVEELALAIIRGEVGSSRF
jgi:hypothetical protein